MGGYAMITIFVGCLLHVLFSVRGTQWELNAVYNVTQTVVHSSNLSDCFVCISGPANSHQGFPLEADPLRPEAWLAAGGAAMSTERTETKIRYEIAVAHSASLCYASTQGTAKVGEYPRCSVTVEVRQRGSQKGTMISTSPVTRCYTSANMTILRHVQVAASMWVTNYGAIMTGVINCTIPKSRQLKAMRRTPAGVLIASIEPYFSTEEHPKLLKKGWFFLCGTNAYKSLPGNWTGRCAIGTIRPAMEVLSRKHRVTRSVNPLVVRSSRWWSFMRMFFPSFGVMEIETALVNISLSMERFANYTARGLTALQLEIKSISAFAYQNRLALDFLLIQSGGVCQTLNITCCFLLDKSGEISTDIDQIRKQAALYHEISKDEAISADDISSWMKGIFGAGWSGWLTRILLTLIGVCLLFGLMRQCISQCVTRLCATDSYGTPAHLMISYEANIGSTHLTPVAMCEEEYSGGGPV